MKRIVFIACIFSILFLSGCSANKFDFNKKAKLKKVCYEEIDESNNTKKILEYSFDYELDDDSFIDEKSYTEYYQYSNQGKYGLVNENMSIVVEALYDQILGVYNEYFVLLNGNTTIVKKRNDIYTYNEIGIFYPNGFLKIGTSVFDFEYGIIRNCCENIIEINRNKKDLIIKTDNQIISINKKGKIINKINMEHGNYSILKNGNIIHQQLTQTELDNYDFVFDGKQYYLDSELINYKTGGIKELDLMYYIYQTKYITKYNTGYKAAKYLYKYNTLYVYPIVDNELGLLTKIIVNHKLKPIHVYDSVDEEYFKVDRKHFTSSLGYLYYKKDEVLASGITAYKVNDNVIIKNSDKYCSLVDKDGIVVDKIEMDEVLYVKGDNVSFKKNDKLFIYNSNDLNYKVVDTYNYIGFVYDVIIYDYYDHYEIKTMFGELLKYIENDNAYKYIIYNKISIFNVDDKCYIIKR